MRLARRLAHALGVMIALGAAGAAQTQVAPANPGGPPVAPGAAPAMGASPPGQGLPLTPVPNFIRPEPVITLPAGAATPGPALTPYAPPASRRLQRAAPSAPHPPAEPLKRPRFSTAILQGVDKITAETLRFEAKVGEPLRYKGLILTVHACETSAADEDAPEAAAHLEVQSQPELLAGGTTPPPRLVYRGWMFASSPTIHPFQHPVYDLWLIACRTDSPPAPGSSR